MDAPNENNTHMHYNNDDSSNFESFYADSLDPLDLLAALADAEMQNSSAVWNAARRNNAQSSAPLPSRLPSMMTRRFPRSFNQLTCLMIPAVLSFGKVV